MTSLPQAYAHCLALAQAHYENFPVASRLLPRPQREAVAVIYAFARQADDMADEGDWSPNERLAMLDAYTQQLHRLARGETADTPVFIALADVQQRFALPFELFHDLLSAFRQDVVKTRYADFAEVMDYCRRSADPVGRLLLHLHGEADKLNCQLSDRICSALQLINFMQDLQQDLQENDRLYLPLDELQAHGLEIEDLRQQRMLPATCTLVDQQLARIETMMRSGAPLGRRLSGRFGLEIRLITEAGLRVLEHLARHRGQPYRRPRLAKSDYLLIAWRALFRQHR